MSNKLYFHRDNLISYIGSRYEIESVFKHYKKIKNLNLRRPKHWTQPDEILIRCMNPWGSELHNFEVQLTQQIKLIINVNVYEDVILQAFNYESVKRGEMYKFITGAIGPFNLWYVSEDFFQAMQTYDWNQHNEFIEKKLEERMRILGNNHYLKANSNKLIH